MNIGWVDLLPHAKNTMSNLETGQNTKECRRHFGVPREILLDGVEEEGDP